jgi:signal transduction histidine kinase
MLLMLALVVLQTVLVFITLNNASKLGNLVNDLQTILIIFLFVIFVVFIIMLYYLPYKLRKSLKEVEDLIEQISQGDYKIDIDFSTYDQDADSLRLILALDKMIKIIMRFDQVKADKIFEHHQRINQLINILPQGVLIVGTSGEVAYCNDRLRVMYPILNESDNINEFILNDIFDSRLFNTISLALRHGKNLYNEKVKGDANDPQAIINGSIIRDRKGFATGAVFVIDIIHDAAADQDSI